MAGRIARDKTVFLLCDIQERFRTLIYGIEQVTDVAIKMNKFSTLMSIPLVYTEHCSNVFGQTLPEIKESIQNPHFFGNKTQFSMITPEVLQSIQQFDTVVLYGIEAHICIQQTTFDLLANNKEVHLLADGISSSRKLDRAIGLQRAQQQGAFVSTMESVMFELMRSKECPEFKEAIKIITANKPIEKL